MEISPHLVAVLWAGALLGGAFIAAPAKFTVETLTTAELLAGGRAQFQALAWAELVLAVALLAALLWKRPRRWWLVAVPIVIFAEQQLVLMPALDDRTLARIAGDSVEDSPLHLVYVVLETLKLLSLIALAFYWQTRRPKEPRHG